MTEQQEHLQQAIQKQKELIAEVNELNTVLSDKRETIIKYQGIIEYLTSTGVTLSSPKIEDDKKEDVEKKENTL